MITTKFRTEDEPIPGAPGCFKVHEWCVLTCEICGLEVEGYSGTHPKKLEDWPVGVPWDGRYSMLSMRTAAMRMSRHNQEHGA